MKEAFVVLPPCVQPRHYFRPHGHHWKHPDSVLSGLEIMKGFGPQNILWKKITLLPLAALSNCGQDFIAKDRVAMLRGKKKENYRTSWSYWKLSWINLQFDNLGSGIPPVRFKWVFSGKGFWEIDFLFMPLLIFSLVRHQQLTLGPFWSTFYPFYVFLAFLQLSFLFSLRCSHISPC